MFETKSWNGVDVGVDVKKNCSPQVVAYNFPCTTIYVYYTFCISQIEILFGEFSGIKFKVFN